MYNLLLLADLDYDSWLFSAGAIHDEHGPEREAAGTRWARIWDMRPWSTGRGLNRHPSLCSTLKKL